MFEPMWEQYRKTWIPTQSLILGIGLMFLIFGQVSFITALIFVIIMQLFAIVGAAWSLRLRGKVARAQKKKEWTLR